MSDREKWLNGWPRIQGGDTVLIGNGVHCCGCGKFFGITTVGITDNWTPPKKDPDWPFEEQNCPLCDLRYRFWDASAKLTHAPRGSFAEFERRVSGSKT